MAMKGKKGVIFTIIAIMFLCLLFFSMSIKNSYTLRERSFIVGDRIKSIDFFISDLEKDIQRGTYIAMFRAILGIQQQITSEGEFINDTQEVFKELLLDGSIDGQYLSIMNNTELTVWIDKIQDEAEKIAINFNYTINDVRLYHTSPWAVTVDLNVTMEITDLRNTASWLRDQIITESVNIETFEDPIYTVMTYGRVINTIERTNITDFTDGDDTTNLQYHIDNRYYIESNSSPSYIMRLSGNLSNSSYGIESIVNLKLLEDMLIPIQDKSCIDYVYFSNSTPASWLINNTYNWLRLDNESGHLAKYEVEHLII